MCTYDSFCTHICLHVCACAHVYLHACVCVCMNIVICHSDSCKHTVTNILKGKKQKHRVKYFAEFNKIVFF